MVKKYLSSFMAILMLFMCIPINVFAENDAYLIEENCENEESFVNRENIIEEQYEMDNNAITNRYTILILDSSGSMSGNPLGVQKEAAIKFCDSLLKAEGENYISIIQLNSNPKILCDFVNDISILEVYINDMKASGNTEMNGALELASGLMDNVQVSENIIKNIVLCSDGRPNNSSSVINTATELKKSCNLYTLGFFHNLSGSSLTSARELLQSVASNQQQYYEVTSAEELEFAFGEMSEDLLQSKLKELYIQQHRDYIASSDFSIDIAKDFDGFLLDVLNDSENDPKVKGYNGYNFLNQFLNFNIDVTSESELLLIQIMLNERTYEGIKEDFSTHYQENICKAMEELCNVTKNEANEEADSLRDELINLYNKAMKQDYLSDEWNKAYAEYCDCVNERISLKDASNKLDKIGKGFKVAGMFFTVTSDVLKYWSAGEAYMQMSDDFTNSLLRIYAAYYEYQVGAGTDGLSIPEDISLIGFESALIDFISLMKDYKDNGAKSIADIAVSSMGKVLYNEAVDTLYDAVPVLGKIKGFLSVGQTVIDLFTDMDDLASAGNMLRKLNWVSKIIYTATNSSADILKNKENIDEAWAEAGIFDELVNLYKVSKSMACDYGIEYERYVLDNEVRADEKYEVIKLFGETPHTKKISECGLSISSMYATKMITELIKCHNDSIIYDHITPITYDSSKLKIFIIACPVDILIKDNLGSRVAVLSDSGNTVQRGYESYLFSIKQKNSDEILKIAVVPLDYDVSLTGTDSGTMDIYMGDIENSNIVKAVESNDITVYDSMKGEFKHRKEELELYDLVIDDDIIIPYTTLIKDSIPSDDGENPITPNRKVQHLKNKYASTGKAYKIKVGSKITQKVYGAKTKVTYSSSNTKIARVGKTSGVITAVDVGKVVIASKAEASSKYKSAIKKFTLYVIPKTVGIKSLKSKKKGQVTIKSNTSGKGNTGYQIQYKVGKGRIKNAKKKSSKSLLYTVKNLKSKKKFRTRIRAYKIVDGRIYYGKYGRWKTLKRIK